MRKIETILCVILMFMMFGCHKHPTKPDVPVNVPWERVECFGNQPIFALYTSSDSTSLHAISTDKYGYLDSGRSSSQFQLTSLADSIPYMNSGQINDYIPYFTDDKCFLGNAGGTKIYVYDIQGGAWIKIGELNLWDFITDTPEYTERFGRSWWINLTNHITWAGGSHYYITIEQDRGAIPAHYGAIYKHYLISLTDTSPVGYNLIYETVGHGTSVDTSLLYGSCFIGDHFLQDIWANNCHIILSKDSPQYIQGSGNYPIRDKFFFEDFLVGMADGVVMKSYDMGINWQDWAYINGAWAYTFIGGKHILFFANNISHWKLEDSIEESQMLESDELLGHRIHYLKEFNGYVYAATNKGLFRKPVSEFFTPRPESKDINHPTIKRR